MQAQPAQNPRFDLRAAPLWCALAAGCAGTPGEPVTKDLSDAAASAGRIFDQFLSPSAMARDVDDGLGTGRKMYDRAVDSVTAHEALSAIARREASRPSTMVRDTGMFLQRAGEHLVTLPDSNGWTVLDPGRAVTRLDHAVTITPDALRLNQRILREHDDRELRTDPADDGPEAGWLQRILRRILP